MSNQFQAFRGPHSIPSFETSVFFTQPDSESKSIGDYFVALKGLSVFRDPREESRLLITQLSSHGDLFLQDFRYDKNGSGSDDSSAHSSSSAPSPSRTLIDWENYLDYSCYWPEFEQMIGKEKFSHSVPKCLMSFSTLHFAKAFLHVKSAAQKDNFKVTTDDLEKLTLTIISYIAYFPKYL